jgi:hypothetical protein
MEIKDLKQFDIDNTIDADELSKRWGVSKKTIDNKRSKGVGPGYWKITGTILYDLDDVKKIEQESYISNNA